MAKKIMLKNVRLSFPDLYKKSTFNGQEGKYGATLLLDKMDEDAYEALTSEIQAQLAEAKVKVSKDKWFLKDGDDSEYDGYEGMYSIKASNNQRPTLVDKDAVMSVPEDELFYAGCYVNVSIGIWIQNNNYGKRVNCNLLGVQFVKDGKPMGGTGKVAAVDDFAPVATPKVQGL